MRFWIIYLLARLRGLLPERELGDMVTSVVSMNTMRTMYAAGYIPYRISVCVTWKMGLVGDLHV